MNIKKIILIWEMEQQFLVLMKLKMPNLKFSIFMKTKSVDDKKFCKSKYLHIHSKNESFGNREVIKPSN